MEAEYFGTITGKPPCEWIDINDVTVGKGGEPGAGINRLRLPVLSSGALQAPPAPYNEGSVGVMPEGS